MQLKNIYIQKVEEQLTEWTMEIESLETRAGNAVAEARIAYLKKVDDLKAKQNAAQVTLKSLKEASEESWEDLKMGYEKLQQDIRKSIENAHTSFK